VTAHYNTNSSPLTSLFNDHPSTHLRFEQADLSSESSVGQLFSRIHSPDGLGIAHVVIVNHAIYVNQPIPVMDMSLAQWESTLNKNLTSSFLVVREYLRRLNEATAEDKDRANIVLIGSTAGKHGELYHADYASSKSGKYMCKPIQHSLIAFSLIKSDDVWILALSQERNRQNCSSCSD
jgi:NAD(P)-dependent dehydrogenase (short-subunit alcohol dehydrogenase family)